MNPTTYLFSELAGPQKDASGAGTRDSLISDSSSSELSSDEKRHSEDLGGERGGRGEGGEREEEEYLYRIYQHQTCYIRAYGKAGNGNKMEIRNRNWKLGMGPKNAPITGAMFSSGTHE